MPSILPDFEYDIFVSYRQKDNKFDGWVSRFIADLQNELDATFKEDINIYFDENPHDGLHDIHNVDKSLETKLKSMIFIPVLSQTYCDPNSFAWEHEFRAFNKMASEDKYGRDIRLGSGNVSSRIIPIVIRELDASDIKLVEDELGARLRTIDFIFSGAGVNRPLSPSDSPEKNLNKTFYRDQINKVAYAVRDVIYAMHPDKEKHATKSYRTYNQSQHGQTQEAEGKSTGKATAKPIKPIIYSIIAVAAVALILLFVYPGWFRNDQLYSSRGLNLQTASIAVLPVSNLTGNTDLDWIPMSIQDDIITPLSCTRELVVRPKQSTLQFKDSVKPISEIAKDLQVNHLLEATVKGSEEDLKLEIRLVEVEPQEHYIWARSYNTSWEALAGLYPEIVNNVFRELKIGLSDDQRERVESTGLTNPEIKKLCKRGEYYMNKLTKEDFQKGVAYVQKAMDIDPADPLPYITLAMGYSISSHIADVDPEAHNLSQAYAKKALELDSMNMNVADAYVAFGSNALYFDWDFRLAKRYLTRALELNPNNPDAHYHYGWYMTLEGNTDSSLNEFHRSIEIDPLNLYYTHNIAWYYVWIGEFDKAVAPALKTLELDPDYAYGQAVLGLAYVETGRYKEGLELQRKALEQTNVFEHYLGISYERAGMPDSAKAVIARLEGYSSNWFNFGRAEFWAELGNEGKAMQNVEKAFELHQDFVPWFDRDYYLRTLRDNPRFKEICNSFVIP